MIMNHKNDHRQLAHYRQRIEKLLPVLREQLEQLIKKIELAKKFPGLPEAEADLVLSSFWAIRILFVMNKLLPICSEDFLRQFTLPSFNIKTVIVW
jgi:hypothetical protein